MLNDDFDLFNVQQEVIYDSALERLLLNQKSIKDSILEAANK